jgi:hypothetical protein
LVPLNDNNNSRYKKIANVAPVNPQLSMKYILVSLLCTVIITASARSQQVINTTGATILSNTHIIEYSIGELAITTISAPNNYATQGVLQPYVKVINPTCNIINQAFQYFPSPTYDRLRLVGQYNWIDAYQVFAADGKLVRSLKFYNNEIDLTNLPTGVYFIRMLPGCNNNYKTIKILKTIQ